LMTGLSPGCETPSSRAAPLSEPFAITDRNTSSWRCVIRLELTG
jgi:hypothetical protein